MHLETHLSPLNNKAHIFTKRGTLSRAHTTRRKAHRHGSQALAQALREPDRDQAKPRAAPRELWALCGCGRLRHGSRKGALPQRPAQTEPCHVTPMGLRAPTARSRLGGQQHCVAGGSWHLTLLQWIPVWLRSAPITSAWGSRSFTQLLSNAKSQLACIHHIHQNTDSVQMKYRNAKNRTSWYFVHTCRAMHNVLILCLITQSFTAWVFQDQVTLKGSESDLPNLPGPRGVRPAALTHPRQWHGKLGALRRQQRSVSKGCSWVCALRCYCLAITKYRQVHWRCVIWRSLGNWSTTTAWRWAERNKLCSNLYLGYLWPSKSSGTTEVWITRDHWVSEIPDTERTESINGVLWVDSSLCRHPFYLLSSIWHVKGANMRGRENAFQSVTFSLQYSELKMH